ncbi:unnamed protein product, partial [Didymodactylos carnosus]
YKIQHDNRLQSLLVLDLFSVILHEFMHTMLRLILNDMNISTPVDFREAGISESGTEIEYQLFGFCPDWLTCYEMKALADSDINIILTSLCDNQPIKLPIDCKNYARRSTKMALDITSLTFNKPFEI